MKKFYTFFVLILLITCINCKLFSQEKSCIANRLSFKLSASMNYLDHFMPYYGNLRCIEGCPVTGMRSIMGLNVRSGVELKLKRKLSLSSTLIFNQKGYEIKGLSNNGNDTYSSFGWNAERFYYMGLLVSTKYYALQLGRFNLFMEGGISYNVGLDDHEGIKKAVIDGFASLGTEIKLCDKSFLMFNPTFITALGNYAKKDKYSGFALKPYKPYSAGLEIGFRRALR